MTTAIAGHFNTQVSIPKALISSLPFIGAVGSVFFVQDAIKKRIAICTKGIDFSQQLSNLRMKKLGLEGIIEVRTVENRPVPEEMNENLRNVNHQIDQIKNNEQGWETELTQRARTPIFYGVLGAISCFLTLVLTSHLVAIGVLSINIGYLFTVLYAGGVIFFSALTYHTFKLISETKKEIQFARNLRGIVEA